RGRAGRTRGHRRVVRAAEAGRDRELPARRVDEDIRDEGRRDTVGAALTKDLRLFRDPRDPADRRAEEDRDAVRRVRAVKSRVGDGLVRSTEREEDVAVEAARLLWRRDRQRIEVLHLGGDAYGELARVEGADPADPAFARDRCTPRRRRIASDR